MHGIQSSVLTSLSSQETNQLSDKELHLESTDTQNQFSAKSVKYSEVGTWDKWYLLILINIYHNIIYRYNQRRDWRNKEN